MNKNVSLAIEKAVNSISKATGSINSNSKIQQSKHDVIQYSDGKPNNHNLTYTCKEISWLLNSINDD